MVKLYHHELATKIVDLEISVGCGSSQCPGSPATGGGEMERKRVRTRLWWFICLLSSDNIFIIYHIQKKQASGIARENFELFRFTFVGYTLHSEKSFGNCVAN